LPAESAVAAFSTITLPETFGEYEITVPPEELELASEEDLLSANRVAHQFAITLHQDEEMMMTPAGVEMTAEEIYRSLQRSTAEEPLSRLATPDRARQGDLSEMGLSAIGPVIDGGFDPGDIPEPAMEDSVLAPDFGVLPLEGEDVPVLAPRLSELEPGIPTPQITVDRTGLAVTPPPEAIGESPTRGEKRKRVNTDALTIISTDDRKAWLENPEPTLRDLDPAPPTKRLMLRSEAEKRLPSEIFTQPTSADLADSSELMALFTRTMTTEVAEEEGEEEEERRMPVATPVGEPSTGLELPPVSPIPGGPHEFVPPEIGGYEFEEPSTLEQPAEAEQGEEAQAEETVPVENWSERTWRMKRFLANTFAKDPTVQELSFKGLVMHQNKQVAAGTFFEFLVMKTRNHIDLRQEEPYGDIFISRTPKFGSVVPSATPRSVLKSVASPAVPTTV